MSVFAEILSRGGFLSSTGEQAYDPALGRYVNADGKVVGSYGTNYDVSTGALNAGGAVTWLDNGNPTPLTEAERLQVENNWAVTPELKALLPLLTDEDKRQLSNNVGGSFTIPATPDTRYDASLQGPGGSLGRTAGIGIPIMSVSPVTIVPGGETIAAPLDGGALGKLIASALVAGAIWWGLKK